MKLILASASPRRAELLSSAGLAFEVKVAGIDETPLPGESPEELVCRLSLAKAKQVFVEDPPSMVLAADTVVVFDDQVFGKPQNEDEARRMLKDLSGDAHEVITGFTLVKPGKEAVTRRVSTEVQFRKLSDSEISDYVSSGEPMDKAGAYGIQGGAAKFVSRIEGSYTNVVGLPLAEVMEELARIGGTPMGG